MSRARAWLTGFASIVGVAIVTCLALPLLAAGSDVEGNRWVRDGLARKLPAARARSHKVVLLGGSNALFGFSARHLEEAHGIPAVNIAQHAGLGRPYILHYGEAVAQPGDVIVLSLEYALWEREKSRDIRNFYILAHDSAYLYSLPPIQMLEFVAGVRLQEWQTLLAARLRGDLKGAPPTSGYRNETIDDWGDETANAPERATAELKAQTLAATPPRAFMLDRHAVAEVRQFADRLASRGARVVVTFPGLLRRDFAAELNRHFYPALAASLQDAGLMVAGHPSESPFDEDCLFDSRYHPIRPCTLARTDRLAAQLRTLGVVQDLPPTSLMRGAVRRVL